MTSADRSETTIEALLVAAAKCFAEKGVTATTIVDIAKQAGLRKSVVHYHFASKAAIVYEVQAATQHKFLERVLEVVESGGGDRKQRMFNGLTQLWTDLENDPHMIGFIVEVWGEARLDPELKRRAALLQQKSRQLVAQGVSTVMGAEDKEVPYMEPLSILVLAVLNGLAIAEHLEGGTVKSKEAFYSFLWLLGQGMKAIDEASSGVSRFDAGRITATRQALYEVCEARSLSLDDELRTRVESESSLDQLLIWLRRASTAPAANEIF